MKLTFRVSVVLKGNKRHKRVPVDKTNRSRQKKITLKVLNQHKKKEKWKKC